MRPTLDLVRLPYAFTQVRPLLPNGFAREARARGFSAAEQQLEALHRLRLLVPLFRVERDGRAIALAARRGQPDEPAWALAHWQPTSRDDLLEARSLGRLHDPAHEHFIARRRLRRTIGELSYDSSVYLYSPHQLIALPLNRQARSHLGFTRRRGDLVASLDVDPWLVARWREVAQRFRDIVVAVSALEPIYYPSVVGRLSLPSHRDFETFEWWRRTRSVRSGLRWLGVSARWLRDAAEELLREAERIDPLGSWAEVVAEGEPEKWKTLRGDARNAMDLRIGAEVLLLYHDDLVAAGLSKPLPDPPPRFGGPFDTRLKRRRPVDALLTDFGLSPHPRLVLVVEGATERLLMPRVMEQLSLRTDEDFIAIQDAEGVDTDLGPLMAYAIAPRLENEDVDGRYLRLVRPPTRILVVLDPEGSFATNEMRASRREQWIDRLMRTLPKERRTDVIREQVSRYVDVVTWKRSGESFEFAHFTDRQLALAVERLDKRPRRPSRRQRIALIAARRVQGASLDPLLHRVSKVDLADELWPTLERRIDRALANGTERKIPIVRVIDRAVQLANELPRRNLVIAIER